MKKLPAAAAAFLLVLAVNAPAKVRLSLYGGYAATPEASSGEGAVVGAGLGFSLSSILSLDLTAGRWVVPVRPSANGLSRGRLTELPISLELRARFPLGRGGWAVYGAGGLGYALHSFALDSDFAAGWKDVGFEIEERVDHGLAAQVGAGLEIGLGPAVDLDLGVRYTILRTKGSWAMADLRTGENSGGPLDSLNFDALAVQAGFRVAFR
jgi:opacity protein-like surface antigen